MAYHRWWLISHSPAHKKILFNQFRRHLIDHHPGRDVHGHELLEEQLCGVGELDLRDLGLVLAALALEGVVPQVGDGDQAAEVADVDAVGVGHLEETLAEELGGAVRDLTI